MLRLVKSSTTLGPREFEDEPIQVRLHAGSANFSDLQRRVRKHQERMRSVKGWPIWAWICWVSILGRVWDWDENWMSSGVRGFWQAKDDIEGKDVIDRYVQDVERNSLVCWLSWSHLVHQWNLEMIGWKTPSIYKQRSNEIEFSHARRYHVLWNPSTSHWKQYKKISIQFYLAAGVISSDSI